MREHVRDAIQTPQPTSKKKLKVAKGIPVVKGTLVSS